MAQLNDREVQVDVDRNSSPKGNGGKVRSAESCYLLVGGSTSDYSVTINYSTGHFCTANHNPTDVCKGNTYSMAKKFGSIGERNTQDPNQWCKHIKAALDETEMIAEAQDITARTFAGGAPSRKLAVTATRGRAKSSVPVAAAPAPVKAAPQQTISLANLALIADNAQKRVLAAQACLADAQEASQAARAALQAALVAA